MRLSKTSWLFLLIGIFIIALVGLGAVRSKQVVQQRQLNQELVTAQVKLNGFQIDQLTQKKTDLEKQLSQTLSQSETDRKLLSQPIDSIEIGNTLFRLAGTYGIKVTEVKSPGTTSVNLEKVKCSVLALTAKAEGDVPALVSFVSKLNDELTTGVVKSVEITIPDPTTGDKPTVNIQLSIYTYQEG